MKNKTILKEFIHYVVLNVLGMTGLACYILADTFFVSKGLGADGVAALNLAIPVYNFMHGFGLMLGMGGATKYSIYKSRGEQKNADKVFTNTFYAAVGVIILFFCLGIFGSKHIAKFMGADSNTFDMTYTYLKVMLLFAPAFIINDVFLCYVRNDQNPLLATIAMLAGSFSNIILDYLFIFPFNMGMFGAIFATGFAPVISLSILSLHKIKSKNKFHFAKTSPETKLICDIFFLGIPSFVNELASGIVIMVFNFIILKLEGNVGVASYGVVANVSLVVAAIFNGCAQGIQPILSGAYGAAERKKSSLVFKYAIITVMLFSVVIYGGILLKNNLIAEIFNSEKNEMLQILARQGLKIYFSAVPFMGFNIILAVYFTSAENALPAQILTLARGFFVIIPSAFVLSAILKMNGVWMSFPITEMISAIVGMIFFKIFKNMYDKNSNGIK